MNSQSIEDTCERLEAKDAVLISKPVSEHIREALRETSDFSEAEIDRMVGPLAARVERLIACAKARAEGLT